MDLAFANEVRGRIVVVQGVLSISFSVGGKIVSILWGLLGIVSCSTREQAWKNQFHRDIIPLFKGSAEDISSEFRRDLFLRDISICCFCINKYFPFFPGVSLFPRASE